MKNLSFRENVNKKKTFDLDNVEKQIYNRGGNINYLNTSTKQQIK